MLTSHKKLAEVRRQGESPEEHSVDSFLYEVLEVRHKVLSTQVRTYSVSSIQFREAETKDRFGGAGVDVCSAVYN